MFFSLKKNFEFFSHKMQFIWQQIPAYLFATDIYALKTINKFLYTCIPLKKVFDCANATISKELYGRKEHFGTDYHGYFVLKREFLLQCLSGQDLHLEDIYENVFGQNFLWCEFDLHRLLYLIPKPLFQCLHICFFDGKVYVKNWNSIIERKMVTKFVSNPNHFSCVKVCLEYLMKSKDTLLKHGYKIKTRKTRIRGIGNMLCNFCKSGDFSYCSYSNSKLLNFESEQQSDEDFTENDEYEKNYLFNRLDKRESLKRFFKKKVFINNV